MMQLSTVNKIHIIGAVGSGKTTLAKKLCERKNIPHIELDNVVWIRSEAGDIRRVEAERDDYLQSLMMKESWVIEGAHYQSWVTPALEKADVIIFLDPSYSVRLYRVIKRWIFQCFKIEKSHYKPSFSMLVSMIRWTHLHEKKNRKVITELVQKYERKAIIITNEEELEEHKKSRL